MPKVALFNISGSQVGEVELNDAVFGIEPNTHVLHEAVVMQRASLRFGTHKVKGRVITSYSIHYTKLYDNISEEIVSKHKGSAE